MLDKYMASVCPDYGKLLTKEILTLAMLLGILIFR